MKYAPSVAMPGQVYTTTEGNLALVVSGMTSSHDLHLRSLWFLAIANLAIIFLHHRALLPCQWRECCFCCVMVPALQVLQPGAVTCLWESHWLHGKAQPAALRLLSAGESGQGIRLQQQVSWDLHTWPGTCLKSKAGRQTALHLPGQQNSSICKPRAHSISYSVGTEGS